MKKILLSLIAFLSLSGFVCAKELTVSVVPERFLRGYDPVTVFYSEDVGPAKPAVIPGPSDALRIEPAVDGEYRWVDSRTVSFLPSVPWPALTTYRIVTKVGKSSLSSMMEVPVAISPEGGSTDLDPFSSIVLTFPTALGEASLKSMLSLEYRDLPGLSSSSSRVLPSSAWYVRELEAGKSRERTSYRVGLEKPVPYGTRVLLRLKLSPDPSLPDSIATYTWDTKEAFRLVAFGNDDVRLPVSASGARYASDQSIDCGTSSGSLYLEFSDRLSPFSVEELKKLVSFSPAVRNLRHEVSDRRVYLSFDADRDRLYKLSVHPAGVVTDRGRPLASTAEASFHFYYRQAEAYLNWKASDVLLERYGPRQLPMESQGVARVDLRIHKIDAESWDYAPFPGEPIPIDELTRPPMSGEEPAPGTDIKAHIRVLPSPPVSKVIDLPVSVTTPRSSWGLDLGRELDAAFGKNAPGTYLVGYRCLDKSSTRYWVRVTVSDLCLTTVEEEKALVFQVTSLSTGEILPGATVRVEGRKERKSVTLIEGKTDSQGRFRYEHRAGLDLSPERVVVKLGADTLIISCDDPPPSFSDNHWASSHSWLSWLTSNAQNLREQVRHKGWLTTERPVYRPDETVYIVGWVRDWKLGEIRRYTGKDLVLSVSGPDDRVWNYPVKEDGAGQVKLEFLEKAIPTGDYSVTLASKDGENLASAQFKILAYRIPLFELNLSCPEKVSLDRPFEVLLTADYYSGGRVTGEDVEWQISQYPYSVRAPQYPGFVFSTDERFSSSYRSESLSSGTEASVLDEDGAAVLRIDPRSERDGKARLYLVTATVRGADRQAVTSTRSVCALPPFSLGLKAESLVKDSLSFTAEFLALDHEEKPLAGQTLTVRLINRQWHSTVSESDFTTGEAKYTSEAVDFPVSESSFVSTASAKELSFTVKEAGLYILEVSSRDYLGRRILAKSDVFVAAKGQVSWERKSDALFEMNPDKKAYKSGETAQILLKSPYSEGWALVVAEIPDATTYTLVPIHGGKGIYSLKVKGSMAPKIPIEALLYRGRAGKLPALGVDKMDLGKPATVGASTELKVLPVENQIAVTLDHPSRSSPGATVSFAIDARDEKGAPVDGEATLYLVDKAVLSLGTEKLLDPLPAFLDSLSSGISIFDTRNRALGFLPVEEISGGDGTDLDTMGELFNRSTVRKNFKTVPFFKTGIPVRNGKATVEVVLPDNLTDFAVRCVVTSGYDRFGTAKSVLPVRLSVSLQQILPRFIRSGDDFVAGGTARITEGKGGAADWAWKYEGLVLTDAKKAAQKTAERISLPDKDTLRLTLPFKAPVDLYATGERASVMYAVERKSDGAKDAFEIELPVRSDAQIQRESALFHLKDNQDQKLGNTRLPQRPLTLERTILVARDPRLLAIGRGFEYLKTYPHGCLEQRTSQLYPSVAMKEFLAAIGMTGPAGILELSFADYLRYLESCQDEASGLVGYWPASTPSVSLSAYVVDFLVDARKAGFKLDEKVFSRLRDGLSKALRSDSLLSEASWADLERVEAFSSLERSGKFEISYQTSLLERSPQLDLYSRATLYLTLKKRGASGASFKALEKGLWESLVIKKEAGKDVLAGVKDFTGSTRVLLTETRAVAAVLEALCASDRKDKRIEILADYLVQRAGADGWGNTRDTVAASSALLSWLEGTKDEDITLALVGADRTVRFSTKGARLSSFVIKGFEGATVRIEKGAGKEGVAVLVTSSYLPSTLGRSHQGVNQGFLLEREYLPVDAEGRLLPARKAQAGKTVSSTVDEVLEEHLSLVNFENQDFVAIEIPLAAGSELLDPRLAGAPKDATPVGRITREPSYSMYLDDKVVFYYNNLPKGTYHFYFRTRSSFEGVYTAPQARAELMYNQAVYGLSDGTTLSIGANPGASREK